MIIEFNWTLASVLNLLVVLVLPLVVGLVTSRLTESWKKAVLLLFLTAVSGFLTEWGSAGDQFMMRDALGQWVVNFIVAVVMRFGLWRPTLEERAQASNVVQLFDRRERHRRAA